MEALWVEAVGIIRNMGGAHWVDKGPFAGSAFHSFIFLPLYFSSQRPTFTFPGAVIRNAKTGLFISCDYH